MLISSKILDTAEIIPCEVLFHAHRLDFYWGGMGAKRGKVGKGG